MGKSYNTQQRRLLAIDECLSGGIAYTMDELVERCNNKMEGARSTGIGFSKRQYYQDIKFLEEGYDAPIVRKGGRISYSDRDFSLRKLPMSEIDRENFEQVMDQLRKFCSANKNANTTELRNVIRQWLGEQGNRGELVGYENVIGYEGYWFDRAFEAIKHRQTVDMEYEPFGRGEKTYTVYPQYLKQYNGRWYLIATKKGDPDMPYSFAIDRILNITANEKEKYEKSGTDFEQYFKDVVGVTRPHGKRVERILLRVDKGEYPYLETKPLHESQNKVGEDDVSVTVELNVVVNYELKQKILAYADHVTVMEPRSLCDSMKSMINKMRRNYDNQSK